MIALGADAPDFALLSHTDRTVRLSDLRGRKTVVLAFHVLAFTPVCAEQMQTYERERARLDALDAVVLGISVDAAPSKKAWAASLGGISFEMLSDFHPHGQVATAYGVMRSDGIAERALVVVDRAGKVAWTKLYAIPEQPNLAELIVVLESLAPNG
jgi:peroxiredoxin